MLDLSVDSTSERVDTVRRGTKPRMNEFHTLSPPTHKALTSCPPSIPLDFSS